MKDGNLGTADGRILSDIGMDAYEEPTQLLGIHRSLLQQTLFDALPEGMVQLGKPNCLLDTRYGVAFDAFLHQRTADATLGRI